MHKTLPPPSPKLLLCPERDEDYEHFKNSDDHPFKKDPPGFCRRNAWWLADAALLAYWDASAAEQRFGKAGFKSTPISDGGTQCYVAWNSDVVIVTFRGTQSGQWADLLDIIRLAPAPWKNGSKVHSGFKDALQRVWDRLEAEIQTRTSAGQSLWFTGHSLGGALAVLAADRLEKRSAGVYTIGSPRVGNPAFVRGFESRFRGRSFRYVNNTDLVTHLPPAVLIIPPARYRHVAQRKFITSQGTVSERRPSAIGMAREWLTRPVWYQRKFERLKPCDWPLPLPQYLIDHTPRRYATHIWNDYDSRGDN